MSFHLPRLPQFIRRRCRLRGRRTAGAGDAFAQPGKFSNLAATARLRHIQSLHENADLRNPDILAGALMTEADRQECRQLGAEALAVLRKRPYYYYLAARTKFYDQLVLDAVADGIRRILILGAGFDTRLYRFGGHLAAFDVEAAECDQAGAIEMKKALAGRLPHARRVVYLPADLNVHQSLGGFSDWLGWDRGRRSLVLAEGVSPYIETSAFEHALGMTIRAMAPGSWLAYDFKRPGVADEFGATSEVRSPFRLRLDAGAVREFHAALGCATVALTAADALAREYLPSWSPELSPPFDEDAVIRATR